MPFVAKEDIEKLEGINRDINSRIVNEDVQRNIQWKPIRFEFSNMFSYGENNKIDFTKLGGLMGLFAPNATGKSSLFDAISFCLYDKSSRAYKAQNILNNRKSDFVCHLHFQIDGLDYHIERTAKTINKGKNVKVDVQFWRQDGDDRTSLNGTERRDTNQIIEQYVGKYEDFVLTALSLQGNNALFIDKSQSERKDLLAQFMGLNVFDKLYETATEDIKEVSVLIKNFKKTDFTTELADKATELKDKKGELKEFEKELGRLNTDSTDLNNRIVGLSAELTPMDGNLDLDSLTKQEGTIGRDILHILAEKKAKLELIESQTNILNELSQSIEDTKLFNQTIDIEAAYSNYQREQKALTEATKTYDIAKLHVSSAEETISHLDNHKYDPNCKFCCDNTFVKDAMRVKELLPQLKEILREALVDCTGIQQTLDTMEGVEEQYNVWNDLKVKYSKAIVIKEKSEAELEGMSSKEQLLEHQLESVKVNIQKYHDNEATIKKNAQINEVILGLKRTKGEIDDEIKKVTKDIASVNGSISSISSFIEGIKGKMNDVKELEEKNRLYTYYLDAVKRDGIPYELISKALPVIENEVNNILSQVVDFGVVMDVDGKSINAKIVYDDQEWPLEMCSGMEKFVSGLAIRVALINVCNLPRPNFLVIDEGFGTLDSDNLSSLFMMMQYLKTQFDFIWVISHLEQMRDIVDGLIEIKKENGFSKIDF
jgi:DNA repair exonuclease SbcCD ATPase subunit